MNIRHITVVCAVCISVGIGTSPLAAKTQLNPGMIQEVDQQIVNELLATFEQAERAMQAHDLVGIMALLLGRVSVPRVEKSGCQPHMDSALRPLQRIGKHPHVLDDSARRPSQ